MGHEKELQEAKRTLQDMFGAPIQVEQAEVKDVDETSRSMTVIIDGYDNFFCRLQAITDLKEGIYVVPKKGSQVLVGRINNDEFRYLVYAAEIDKIVFKIGKSTGEIKDGLMTFNDGNNGGLTNTPELKDQLAKLTKRVDDIIAAIQSPTVIATPQDGGKSLWSLFNVQIAQIQDKEDFSKIEDKKIKH